MDHLKPFYSFRGKEFILLGEGNFARVISASHRRRLKRRVVSTETKDQNGVWRRSFTVPSKRDEQKPALTQE